MCATISARCEVSVLFSEPKIPQRGDICLCPRLSVAFQCSSASRKFLKARHRNYGAGASPFQCSSASRKFLNLVEGSERTVVFGFSALQRAENSSTDAPAARGCVAVVSVLFSEPKIPQCRYHARTSVPLSSFSALQRAENSSMSSDQFQQRSAMRFSALQRAENSSIWMGTSTKLRARCFSALQRAENSSTLPSRTY